MYVGLLMLGNVTEAGLLAIRSMPSPACCAPSSSMLTCNIVTGIMLGFVALVVGRICLLPRWKKAQRRHRHHRLALVIFYAGGWAHLTCP